MSNDKPSNYFKEIIKKLLQFAEKEWVDDQEVLFIRERNIQNHLMAIGYDPGRIIPKMVANGFLKIKLDDPPGYTLVPEGNKSKGIIILPTKKLQQIARKLWKWADRDETFDFDKERRFNYLKIIQQKLVAWGYDPDMVIPQLIRKNYLVKRNKDHEPDSYWIAKTQKEGQAI